MKNYSAQLDTGEKLKLSNQDAHTQITLESSGEGRNQNQSSAFPTGTWSQNPELFGIGVGAVAQITAESGQNWFSIDQNGIHLLDRKPNLDEAQKLELAENDAPAPQPMTPMQPMKPMNS